MKKATTAISGELLLFITGKTVSITVAPPVEIDSNEPILLATIGTAKIASNSLKIFERKAIPPSSALTFESSIAEREYQPNPALTARLSPTEREVKKEARKPAKRVPTVVVRGTSQILIPNRLIAD